MSKLIQKNSNLLILTDAGFRFGYGHLTRTLSVASLFKKENYSISYFVHSDEKKISFLEDTSYLYEIINWKKDLDKIIQVIINKSSLVLIDSLEIDIKDLKKIEEVTSKIIFFDDEKRRNLLNKGFVIDWTILSDKKDFFHPRKKNVRYFLGSKYIILREEFNTIPKNKIRRDIKSIMISFGGSDIRNLTPKVLKFFTEKYPNIIKNIVLGPASKNIEEVKKNADKNTNIFINLNSKNMIKCMQNSDVAISAGGQTLYELAIVGIPTMAILLVDNAKDDTLGWSEVGFLQYIGWYNDKNLIYNLEKLFIKIQDHEVRKRMVNFPKNLLPQNSDENLVNIIVKDLK